MKRMKQVLMMLMSISLLILITACDNYDEKEMIEKHGGITNVQVIDKFIESLEKKRKDAMCLTRYTIEGDPIYYDLSYNGTEITLTVDNSNDSYAGSDKEKRSITCSSIEKIEENDRIKYVLTGCSGENPTRLIFEQEITKEALNMPQDFNFVVRHGVGARNVVNTFDHSLTKDLIADGIITMNDFRLSEAEMKKIYEEMIKKNVLSPKKLTANTNCHQEPFPSYYLKIQMNGEVREYSWSKKIASTPKTLKT